jgi:prophage regulatory protein
MFNNHPRGANMSKRILRRPAVQHETGDPRSTLYYRIAEGLFPKPIHLGPRSVGWPEEEVDALNAARIAGKSDEEIRTLVKKLEAARKDCGARGQ